MFATSQTKMLKYAVANNHAIQCVEGHKQDLQFPLPKTRQNTYILGMPSDRCANDNGCWLGGKTNIALVTLGRKNCVVEVRKVVTVYCDNWSFIAGEKNPADIVYTRVR